MGTNSDGRFNQSHAVSQTATTRDGELQRERREADDMAMPRDVVELGGSDTAIVDWFGIIDDRSDIADPFHSRTQEGAAPPLGNPAVVVDDGFHHVWPEQLTQRSGSSAVDDHIDVPRHHRQPSDGKGGAAGQPPVHFLVTNEPEEGGEGVFPRDWIQSCCLPQHGVRAAAKVVVYLVEMGDVAGKGLGHLAVEIREGQLPGRLALYRIKVHQ